MSSDRIIEHEIVVPGTPEQVWQAIATGQGITGWFVPANVEERTGGAMELDFGPGMGTVRGQVTVWEPPTRFRHLGMGAAGSQVAYEWQVEARSGGTCLVRLVTSGFLSEADWQAEYDGTAEGWKLFLNNLRLYLSHFTGQRCSSMLVQQLSNVAPDDAWRMLTGSLGLPEAPTVGQQVSVPNAPALSGRVDRFDSRLMTLLLDAPGRGIGVVGTESFGGKGFPLVYLYLFGTGAEAAIRRDETAWRAWMERTFNPPGGTC
jgi:uncharacterized protein YndB with AHSA1/START domain